MLKAVKNPTVNWASTVSEHNVSKSIGILKMNQFFSQKSSAKNCKFDKN